MRNAKRWLAVLLSTAMVLGTAAPVQAAAVDRVETVTEQVETEEPGETNEGAADADEGEKAENPKQTEESKDTEIETPAENVKSGEDEAAQQPEKATEEQPESGDTAAQAAESDVAVQEAEGYIKELSTLGDLLEFANNVNEKGYSYRNETVVLMNDIDASSIDWTPIGELQWTGFGNPVSKAFQGNFDGQGHAITLKCSGERIGMFLDFQYGVVENLTIKGSFHVTKYGGGAFCYWNQGTFKNCVNEADITVEGSASAGGIVDSNYLASSPYYCTEAGKVIDCANYGTIQGSGIAASSSSKSTISGCFNAGTVKDGGIVGINNGMVENCYNTGTVGDAETIAGGIVYISNGTVQKCYNVGKIQGNEKSGAIAGEIRGTNFRNYYLIGTAASAVGDMPDGEDTAKTEAELKAAKIVGKKYLGIAYKVNPNNGYPLLTWQTSNGTEKLWTISDLKVTEYSAASARVTFTAGTAGTVYYLLQAADAEAPDETALESQGQSMEAAKGGNELTLDNPGDQKLKLYLFLKDEESSSPVYSIALESAFLTGVLDSANDTVSFDGASRELTLVYDTDTTRVGFKTLLSENGEDTEEPLQLTYSYVNVLGEEKRVEKTADSKYIWFNDDFVSVSGKGNDLTLTARRGESEQTYVIHVIRRAVLKSIALFDQKERSLKYTPTFSKAKTEYTLSVLDNVESVTLTVEDPAAGETGSLLINGKPVEGNTYTQTVITGLNTIRIQAVNGAEQQREYVLKITREKSNTLTIKTSPKNAVVALYQGNTRVWAREDGSFPVLKGMDYNYTVTARGYVSQTGKVSIADAQQELSVTLERAPEAAELPDLSADYPGFRLGEDNLSVTSARTPVTKDALEIKWERQVGDYTSPTSGTTPIIVGGRLYTLSGTNLYMVNKDTGEVLKKGTTITDPGFGLIPMTYGDGMLFVPLSDGVIQCFNAETLESLWVYEDPLKGRCENSIRYDDGYIYTGFFTDPADFVCISVDDEDPSSQFERKTATWRNDALGSFYWDGCWSNDKYVFVASNAGTVYCLDKTDGSVKQHYTIGEQVRCNIAYYNNRIYLTTQGGSIYSFNLTSDGILDTEHLIAPLKFGGASTSTPAIYNNRLYIGLTHGQNFGSEGFEILVADIDTATGALSTAYTVETDGYVQTSGLISTAYEKEDGYVYVYFLANSPHGTMYLIKDKAGMTEADPASGSFYIPNHEQYCIASAVVDKEGCLYVKNDSGWQYALKTADVYLKQIYLTGGNAVLDGGNSYDGSRKEHVITVDPGTESLKMELETAEGVTVYIDGQTAKSKEITLTSGTAEVQVELRKGSNVRVYQFHVVSGPTLKSLRVDNSVNEDVSKIEHAVLDPEFDYMTTEYTAGFESAQQQTVIWANALNDKDTITVTAVSGCRVGITGANSKGHYRYQLIMDEKTKPTVAEAIVTVTSENGAYSRDYRIIAYTQNALPVITLRDGAVKERTDVSAKIEYTVNTVGQLYYLLQDPAAGAPDAAAIQEKGSSIAASAGTGTLDVTELPKTEQKLYMVLKTEAGASSVVKSLDIPGIVKLGDVNGDGTVNIGDVVKLLDLITAGETVDAAVGDINGDGVVNIGDVVKLLDLVTAGEI